MSNERDTTAKGRETRILRKRGLASSTRDKRFLDYATRARICSSEYPTDAATDGLSGGVGDG